MSGWTIDTLKEYFETRLASARERHDAEVHAMQIALNVARDEMERRLSELNQLRKEVTSDREQFVRHEVYDPVVKDLVKEKGSLEDKVIEITASQAANKEAISGLKNSLGWLARLVIGAVILALIAFGFRALTGR
jgi:hypothetical protein